MPNFEETDRRTLQRTLRQQFDSARYGHYFRTATFLNAATGAQEWLYAVQDPHSRRCILMKVREQDSVIPERIRVKEDMAFFDALDHMNRFENMAANPGYVAVDQTETARLGETHFDHFAKREGLIRDVKTNEYHPTLQGHVVTGGSFDPADVACVLGYSANPPAKPETFLIPGHAQIVMAGETAIDTVMRIFKDTEALRAQIKGHGNLLKISQAYTAYRTIEEFQGSLSSWARMLNILKEDMEEPWKIFKPSGIGGRLEKTYANLGNSSDGFAGFLFYRTLGDLKKAQKFEDPAICERIINLHEIIFEHSRARSFYGISMNGENSKAREKYAEKFKDALKKMEKTALRAGFDDVQTGTLKAYAYGSAPLPYIDEVEDFIKSLVKTNESMLLAISNEKKRLAALAPAAPPAVPGLA